MRKRFAFALLAVTILSSVFIYVRYSAASSHNDYMEYTVKAGDTLWDIAVDNAPRSMDLRDYVYRVRRVNNLNTAVIHPGQHLRLPIVQR